MKTILENNIEIIELIFIAISAVFAFLNLYYMIQKKSIAAFFKLMKIKKKERRVTGYDKKKSTKIT